VRSCGATLNRGRALCATVTALAGSNRRLQATATTEASGEVVALRYGGRA
jgi:hypothetical protein